jgi:hypothetical protein
MQPANVRHSQSRASVCAWALHVAHGSTPFGGTRPLRWRPGCRAAGGLDAVDDIVAIVKNAASPIRDDGDPPAPLRQSAPVGT